jgi:hypothetical protein
VSDTCNIQRTSIDFYKLAETPIFKQGVSTYLFDEGYGLYVLSGSWIVYYVVGSIENSIQLRRYAETTLPKNFDSDSAVFVRTN